MGEPSSVIPTGIRKWTIELTTLFIVAREYSFRELNNHSNASGSVEVPGKQPF